MNKPLNAVEININPPEDFKEVGKLNSSRFDHELFHDEEHVVMPIIRVKYFTLPHQGCRWKVFQDNKIMQVIEGVRLNKKEREFLKSVEGANWLLGLAKVGIGSMKTLKIELKKRLSPA